MLHTGHCLVYICTLWQKVDKFEISPNETVVSPLHLSSNPMNTVDILNTIFNIFVL